MSICSVRTGLAVGVVLGAAGLAQAGVVGAFEVTVPATANIFSSVVRTPVAPGGGGAGTLAVEIVLPALPERHGGNFFSVSAAFGSVSCCNGVGGTFNGPEGGSAASGNTNINGDSGVSGIIHNQRTMFLVGVFTSSNVGAGLPLPPSLDFSDGADNFHELSPLLNQQFFIGDGLANDEDLRHLVAQEFFIPHGATSLWLGFADAFDFDGAPGFYGDNVGELTVVGGFVPTPGAFTLVAGAGLVGLRRRR
ncbi:MAG: hypothetical protein ACKVZJ_01490 [Phycisphaerales bacterium]